MKVDQIHDLKAVAPGTSPSKVGTNFTDVSKACSAALQKRGIHSGQWKKQTNRPPQFPIK